MQVRSAEFVQVSRQMGKSSRWVLMHHIFPHISPQVIIGFMLLFPHVILHETAVTFLGLGLSPHEPAIGIILSESMKRSEERRVGNEGISRLPQARAQQ